jgi:hypothetical protein
MRQQRQQQDGLKAAPGAAKSGIGRTGSSSAVRSAANPARSICGTAASPMPGSSITAPPMRASASMKLSASGSSDCSRPESAVTSRR